MADIGLSLIYPDVWELRGRLYSILGKLSNVPFLKPANSCSTHAGNKASCLKTLALEASVLAT